MRERGPATLTIGSASSFAHATLGFAARSVQKKLEAAFVDKADHEANDETHDEDAYDDYYYDDEDYPLPPTGGYEDLEGFTHYGGYTSMIRMSMSPEVRVEADDAGEKETRTMFHIPAEFDQQQRQQRPPSPARAAWGAPSPSPRPKQHRRPTGGSSPSPSPPSRHSQELSPLPPRLKENLPLFQPAPARVRDPSASAAASAAAASAPLSPPSSSAATAAAASADRNKVGWCKMNSFDPWA